MSAYYNEIDPFAAEWLRELIKINAIAPGDVDERDIRDVKPEELKGYTQHHFFAGIGVWSRALRQAGWSDERPICTGSCPCQPFSAAGRGAGFFDERHLWPHWLHLVRELGFDTIVGEQVASKAGLAWLDLVSSDLEGEDYAFGAVDTCAAGFGAPHIRQRTYWMAHTKRDRQHRGGNIGSQGWSKPSNSGELERLANPNNTGSQGRLKRGNGSGERAARSSRLVDEVAHAPGGSPTNGYWGNADWIGCQDEKWRAVEPGSFPLVNGLAGRVGLIRGYGNAIVLPQAQAFVETVIEVIEEMNPWLVAMMPKPGAPRGC